MGQSKDDSNTGLLTEPELNPLLNPLLAAHMGRWAEVYFTTPPEKRAQAVSDLVRELANNSSSLPASSPPHINEPIRAKATDEPIRAKAERQVYEDSSSGSGDGRERPVILCESCGHKNAAQQKFCGMCGALLTVPLVTSAQPVAEAVPIAAADWSDSESPISTAPEQHNESPAVTAPRAAVHEEAAEHRAWPVAEDNSARFSVLSDYESEPARHRYRIYVGLGVAILLGLLVYVTWRSNEGQRGTQPELPDAPPAVKSEAPAAAAPHAAMEPASPAKEQPSPKAGITPRTAPVASAAPSQNGAGAGQKESPSSNERNLNQQSSERQGLDHRRWERRSQPTVQARASFGATPRATTAPASPAVSQSGSEELSAAERYLNTGPGTARDSRQAATWLWKAVAKQNLTATLLLSDLYLRGDGVSKSCDQARLLLDAAARKGATTAAERLRHLPAFGCR